LLHSVAVNQDQQRQGYGALLVNHVIDEAKKSLVEDLFLLTTTAPAFFKKLIFKDESREKAAGGTAQSTEFKSALAQKQPH